MSAYAERRLKRAELELEKKLSSTRLSAAAQVRINRQLVENNLTQFCCCSEPRRRASALVKFAERKMRKETELEVRSRKASAILIQALWRGMRGRRRFEASLLKLLRNEAAIEIQRYVRGVQVRASLLRNLWTELDNG